MVTGLSTDVVLHRSFKQDRMIEVYVADIDEPLFISRNLLARSSSVFEELLQQTNTTPQDHACVLRFPEDNLDAWKLLMFWMTQKRVPEVYELLEPDDCDPSYLVRCWCLGDKYQLPLFQDAVMHQLLYRP